MSFYDKLYYRLLILWSFKKNEAENAPINAVITISLMIYFNLLTLAILIREIPLSSFIQDRVVFFSSLIGWGLVNAYIFLRRSKREFFRDAFNKDNENNKRRLANHGLLYIIGSIALLVTLILLPLEEI